MGTLLENPIQQAVSNGARAVNDLIRKEGPARLFVWLALIFVKTHLRDRNLRIIPDRREPDIKIGELYDWSQLHHLHCVARSFFTQPDLDAAILGSFGVFPAQTGTVFGDFDYKDISDAQALILLTCPHSLVHL
jgi:hypothetical protein